jgi:hypothetical protein
VKIIVGSPVDCAYNPYAARIEPPPLVTVFSGVSVKMAYRDQTDAKAAARATANRLGVAVHVIKLKDGYHVMTIAQINPHRPATYITIQPTQKRED